LKVIDDVLGLNAQGALNYQLSLCARVRDLSPTFIRESLDRRAFVRTWMMRNAKPIFDSLKSRLSEVKIAGQH